MYKNQCPRCSRRGWVRTETIIKGESTTLELYCGACDFVWRRSIAQPEKDAPRGHQRDE